MHLFYSIFTKKIYFIIMHELVIQISNFLQLNAYVLGCRKSELIDKSVLLSFQWNQTDLVC